MELNTSQMLISAVEPVTVQTQEQSVELDYVLPDYYPDVCKMIKCFMNPVIASQSVSDNRLSYDLSVAVRILYCSENSHVLQCVTQTLHFSRTVELTAGKQAITKLLPVTDYVNCRAVSRRRLDVRGAVTVKIRTSDFCQQEAVSEVSGKNIQVQKQNFSYQSQRLHTVSRVMLSEELELGSSQPALLQIVRCSAFPVEQTQKFVSGKIMMQGNLQIQILYACEKDGDGNLEPMSFRIPYSQMIEPDGIEEQDDLTVSSSVISCDLKPVTDENGDVRMLRCEAELCISCTAYRTASVSLVCDAFSTECPSIAHKMKLRTNTPPVAFAEMLLCNVKLTAPDSTLDCVCDTWGEIKNLTDSIEQNEIVISGMLCCFVLVRESSGMPQLLEKEEPFEYRFQMSDLSSQDMISLHVTAENCSYTLSGESEVSFRTELHMNGTVIHCRETEVLSQLELQEEESFSDAPALKLYFGKEQESVWEIAKHCHTSVEAIMEENDLTQERLSANGMLLIPIVS